MRTSLWIAAAAAALALAPSAARADHPCKADVERLCKGVQPGGGRIAECLEQHLSEVSAECKEKRADVEEKLEQAKDACEPDVAKFCAGVESGRGKIARCLKEHEKDLSEACKAVGRGMRRHGERARAEGRQRMEACKPDVEKLCAGVQPGGGRIAQCLQSHRADLSAACGQALQQR